MTSGMACYLTFSSCESEARFKKWVIRGNEKNEVMGLTSFGLQAKVLLVAPHKYLFLWSHFWVLSFAWLLRFMLWLQLRKVRKTVNLERVGKLSLVELVLDRGLKD